MPWKLASTDHILALDLNEGTGSLNGTLSFGGKTYGVAGALTASAFGLSGGTNEAVPTYLAAIGTITGPVDSPTQVKIQVDVASSADGTIKQYQGVLVPGVNDPQLPINLSTVRRSPDGLEPVEC